MGDQQLHLGRSDLPRPIHITDCNDAVVVGIRSQSVTRASNGRGEALAALEVCARTGWFTSAMVNMRLGSLRGSSHIDAGFLISSWSFVDAVNVARQLALVLESVSVGLLTELWTVSSTSFALPAEPSWVCRVVPGNLDADWCALGPRFSPLLECLGREDVQGIVSVALVQGSLKPSADLLTFGPDASTAETLASLAAFEITNHHPHGLGVVTFERERAAQAQSVVAGNFDSEGALPASVLADIYSTTRRTYSASRVVGREPRHDPVDLEEFADPVDIGRREDERR